jgi:hypothetical protein
VSLDPITAGLDFVSKIADKIWPNPADKAAGLLELEKLRQTGELAVLAAETELAKGQLAINAEEAKSENLFVAGWRPFIGWVCGLAGLCNSEYRTHSRLARFPHGGAFNGSYGAFGLGWITHIGKNQLR